jgi:hypothetical protein
LLLVHLLLLLLLPPGNGLFTSSTLDKDWQVAHGLLPRAFNQIRIKNYFGVREPKHLQLSLSTCCCKHADYLRISLEVPVKSLLIVQVCAIPVHRWLAN